MADRFDETKGKTMGMIGQSLVRQMKKRVVPMRQEGVGKYFWRGIDAEGIIDADEMIADGMDPVHAAYASVQNLTSYFAEHMSMLPEMKAYCDIVGPAEDEYMPGGPPMSPLTGSYFTCWAFFDLRFGPDKETIGSCFMDVITQLNICPEMAGTLETMKNSRMGIYEHIGFHGDKVILQELMTQEKHVCYVPAGYAGEKGQLWLVRVLPPANESFDYSIVFNTPYVLTKETRDNWAVFLKRTLLAEEKVVSGYQEFMKYGLDSNYWNEYVFLSYANHLSSAVFLAGLPDVLDSLPHGQLSRTLSPKAVKSKRNRNLKIRKKRGL